MASKYFSTFHRPRRPFRESRGIALLFLYTMYYYLSMYYYCCLCILIYRPCILNVVYVFLTLSMYSYCSSMCSYCCLCILILVSVFLDAATLTEGFPCFFLGCKANARVILAKTGHGLHSSKIVVLFYVLFVFYCFMYCLCVNVYCHRVTTQLQLTNISYHVQFPEREKNFPLLQNYLEWLWGQPSLLYSGNLWFLVI